MAFVYSLLGIGLGLGTFGLIMILFPRREVR
jgi:hypothetical protein